MEAGGGESRVATRRAALCMLIMAGQSRLGLSEVEVEVEEEWDDRQEEVESLISSVSYGRFANRVAFWP